MRGAAVVAIGGRHARRRCRRHGRRGAGPALRPARGRADRQLARQRRVRALAGRRVRAARLPLPTRPGRRDPRARQPELDGSDDAWHQLGNDAHRRQRLQPRLRPALEPGPRLYQWANRYEPARRATTPAASATCASTTGAPPARSTLDRPPARRHRRTFGAGYCGRRMRVGGASRSPRRRTRRSATTRLLLHDVTITQHAPARDRRVAGSSTGTSTRTTRHATSTAASAARPTTRPTRTLTRRPGCRAPATPTR